MARSTVYPQRSKAVETAGLPRRKRGSKERLSDKTLAKATRRVLEANPWNVEGYRKVWARLRFRGIRVSMKQVLRVMREEGLLARERPLSKGHSRNHEGTIIPERPDELWGTDATSTQTGEGQATIFLVVYQYTAECLGIHAAQRETREALVPFRQALRRVFGDFREGIAEGKELRLRHDHGSPFVSDHFQQEVRFAGVTSSPAYVKGTRNQRLCGAFRKNPEGTACLAPQIPCLGGTQPGPPGFHGFLQPVLDPTEASLPYPLRGSETGPEGKGGGGVRKFTLVSKEPGAVHPASAFSTMSALGYALRSLLTRRLSILRIPWEEWVLPPRSKAPRGKPSIASKIKRE